MRSIPVDSTRVNLIASGKCAPKMQYAELVDGQRRATGQQAAHEDTGMPLWVIDCFNDDDDARRAEVVSVTVPSFDEPVTEKWRPVRFVGLVGTVYVDRSSGRAQVSMRAESIESSASSSGRPSPVAAAS